MAKIWIKQKLEAYCFGVSRPFRGAATVRDKVRNKVRVISIRMKVNITVRGSSLAVIQRLITTVSSSKPGFWWLLKMAADPNHCFWAHSPYVGRYRWVGARRRCFCRRPGRRGRVEAGFRLVVVDVVGGHGDGVMSAGAGAASCRPRQRHARPTDGTTNAVWRLDASIPASPCTYQHNDEFTSHVVL